MRTMDSRTITLPIKRHWRYVYELVWRPEAFPKWATGLSRAALEPEEPVEGVVWWRAEGPEGSTVRIRFTDHNPYGVMDHTVDIGNGQIVYVPMRIIPNGEGAEVQFTLFRQPGMSDEKFAMDAAWVARDLEALKVLVTT